jgi:Ca2+-binding RTX toxin-like protein
VMMRGGVGNDVLILGSGNGAAEGGAGNDLLRAGTDGEGFGALSGGDGDDTVFLARGAWFANGGAGNDVLIVDGLDAFFALTSSVEAGDGAIVGLSLRVDFTGFERLSLRGGTDNDTLGGGDGADTLNGRSGGADSLSGGLGNDLYLVLNGNLLADEGGADTVQSDVDWTLGTGFEALVLDGDFGASGTGNAGTNTLIGNGAANTLAGAGGNDLLQGGAGLDSLAGGAGADTLNGGTQADTLRGGTDADVFVLRLNDSEGEVVTDFAGAGVAGGDLLRLAGYGTGVTLTLQSAATFTWRIQGSGGSDLVVLTGVTSLSLANGDYVLVA